MKKCRVSPDDFKMVDDLIDNCSPAFMEKHDRMIKKAREAWGRIQCKYG